MILNKNILVVSQNIEAMNFICDCLKSEKNLNKINNRVELFLNEYKNFKTDTKVLVNPHLIKVDDPDNVIQTIIEQYKNSSPVSLIILVLEEEKNIDFDLIDLIRSVSKKTEIVIATTEFERRKSTIYSYIENSRNLLFIRNIFDNKLLVQLYENLTVRWATDFKLKDYIYTITENKKILKNLTKILLKLEEMKSANYNELLKEILANTLDMLSMNIGLINCDNFNKKIEIGNHRFDEIEKLIREGYFPHEHINLYKDYIICLLFDDEDIFGYMIIYNEYGKIKENRLKYLEILISNANSKLKNAQLYRNIKIKNKELKESNRKLEESNRLNQDFLTISSHELRTPITLISGYAQILDKGFYKDEEELKKIHKNLKVSSIRLRQILGNMLEMNTINNNQKEISFNRSMYTIDELFNGVKDRVENYLEIRNQNLKFIKENSIPKFNVDKNKIIDFVLFNLITNAIKYSQDNNEIIFKSKYDKLKQKIEISIEDFGVGIEKKDKENIFMPFFVINDSKSHHSGVYEYKSSGLGLGLTIVKKTLKLIGEDIHLKIKEKGLVFYFDLPIT